MEDGILVLLNQLTEGKLDDFITSRNSKQEKEYNNEDWLFDETIYDFPVVNTTSGMVMGQTNKDSHAFYSVPYAEPPVGDLR